jgi:hypothetical protein
MKASFILNLNDGTTIDWSRLGREESASQAEFLPGNARCWPGHQALGRPLPVAVALESTEVERPSSRKRKVAPSIRAGDGYRSINRSYSKI